MKGLTSIFIIGIIVFSNNIIKADELEVKMKKYPVSKTFSLGKRGLVFYGEDPKNNSNQKEIVFVKDAKVVWYSQFMPSAYTVIPVYSDESNYMYFVDEGYERGGILSYVYIDNGGNSRKGKMNMSLEMRKIGVMDMSKLDLIKMYSTENYFVILFSEKSGAETSYYALNVAHVSQRSYATKFVQTSYNAKDKYKSAMDFIGTTDGQLMFAQRAVEGDFQGFYITFLTPKTKKEDIRKFEFSITKVALHQKIYTKGVYDKTVKDISSSVTVKEQKNRGFIGFFEGHLIFSGLDLTEGKPALHVKKVATNGTEVYNVRHDLNKEDTDIGVFFEKLKNGTFGFQLNQYRGQLMGAASGKTTFFVFMENNTGKIVNSSTERFSLDELNKHIYYIFSDLQDKKYAWFQICAGDFYTSSQSILNTKEFTITRHKL